MPPKSSLTDAAWSVIYAGLAAQKPVIQIAKEMGRPATTLRSALTAKGISLSRTLPDSSFAGMIEKLDNDPRLSIGKLHRESGLGIPVIIRYLRNRGRDDLCSRHRKNKGLSKSRERVRNLRRQYHFRNYFLTETIEDLELGVVFQNRDSREWVLTIPPSYLIGITPFGLQKVKLRVENGQRITEAFFQQFKIAIPIPTIEDLAHRWGISSEALEFYLDQHAQKYFFKPTSSLQ